MFVELRQLRYFVAVADTLNFSRASESLYVSQSALSKQIADLEQELGVVLFQRDKRTVELSPAGKILLGEAKSILLRSEKIAPLLRQKDLQSRQEQNVYIGIEPRTNESPMIHRVLAEAVYQQRKKQPGLRALFWNQEYLEMKKALIDGELDLGIFLHTEKTVDHNLESCVLFEDEMVLAFRSDEEYEDTEEGALRVLEERGVQLIEKEFRGMSQIVRILDVIGSAPRIRFTESSTDMTLSMESGESSAIIPSVMVKRLHNSKVKMLHFHRPEAKIYLLAVWKKGKQNKLAEEIARETMRSIENICYESK